MDALSVIAAAMITVGLALGVVERFAKHRRAFDQIVLRDVLIIGSAQAVMYEDEILFTYKSNKVSETFDSKAFKDAHPEIVAQFTVSKPGARVLRMVAE